MNYKLEMTEHLRDRLAKLRSLEPSVWIQIAIELEEIRKYPKKRTLKKKCGLGILPPGVYVDYVIIDGQRFSIIYQFLENLKLVRVVGLHPRQ
jgi:hypothetical protein